MILPGTSGSAPDGAPGGNSGSGGQTGGYPQHDGTGLEIRGGRPDENGILRIPPEVYGLPVVEIASDCFKDNQSIKCLDLSGCSALTEIWPYAFDGCTNLVSADFSGCTSLREIGNFAFGNCNNLKEVDLSGCPNLETIAQNAFENCSQLEILHLCGSTDNLSLFGIPHIRNSAVYVQDEEEISALPFSWREQAEICPEHGVRRAR